MHALKLPFSYRYELNGDKRKSGRLDISCISGISILSSSPGEEFEDHDHDHDHDYDHDHDHDHDPLNSPKDCSDSYVSETTSMIIDQRYGTLSIPSQK
jgi:hypothetical protein